jgi:uncharacterized protein YjdB
MAVAGVARVWKTAPNVNVYIEEEVNGGIPEEPSPQALRYISTSLEGSYETIENDSKLPGRNPGKPFKGSSTNAGDLVVNFAPGEHDNLLAAVLCSDEGFVKNDALSGGGIDVYDMVIGNKQRSFYLLKEFSQAPKLYQLFRGLQFNTANLNFSIGALVKLTFNLMGANNPILDRDNPINLDNKKPAFTTEEFITLVGNWKFKADGDMDFEEYIDGVDISLDINNNMSDLQGLFQTEAISKSLGMLDITGSINEYVKDGKLYNLAKQGKGGELHITVRSEKDGAEYTFIFNISFDNSTLSGDNQLQTALPFKTFGENRFMLRKKVPTPVTGVSLNDDSFALNAGQGIPLSVTITPSDAANHDVIWSSENEEIAIVSNDGILCGYSGGTTTITATTVDGGFTASAVVTVSVPATGVSLDISSFSLNVGESRQLSASVEPENATIQDVTWSSDDSDVATVDQSGTVLAIGGGSTTIRAQTADGGFEASAAIEAIVPVTGVTLDTNTLDLNVGNTQQFTATIEPPNATNQNMTWSSDDESVATVDQSGNVQAIGGGNTTIRVVTEDGSFEAAASIEAIVPVTGISLDTTSIGLAVGESQQMTATIDPSNATNQDVVWSSDDESIATVDQSGNVTAIAAGNTMVRVLTADSVFEAYAQVNTHVAVTGISLDTNTLDLNVGNTQQLMATIEPPDATYQEVMWQSSNPGVASVDMDGSVQAVSAGTATITATAIGSMVSDTCEVTVNE